MNLDKVSLEFQALVRHNNGQPVSPRAFWEWAKSHPKSESYKGFDWDLQRAAEEHWTQQARFILARIKVTIVSHGEEIKVRAIVNVPPDPETEEPTRGYQSAEEYMSDSEHRRRLILQILERVLGHLGSYDLEELVPLKRQVEKLHARYSRAEEPAVK